MYPGDNLQVHFTCKEKTAQEQKVTTDIPRGFVKWYVEMPDDASEKAGVASILTMVRKKDG